MQVELRRSTKAAWAVLVGAVALLIAACGGCDTRAGLTRVQPRLEVLVDDTSLAQDAIVDYGVVKVNDKVVAEKRVLLKNLGGAALTLDGEPTIVGSADFRFSQSGGSVLAPCSGRQTGVVAVQIASGDCAVAMVAYVPSDLGPDEATLTVRSDDAERREFRAKLIGRGGSGDLIACVSRGVGPDVGMPLDLCTSAGANEITIDFGGVAKGAASLERRVSVSNRGDLPVAITRVATKPGDPIDFEVSPGDFSATLSNGDAKGFLIVFTPQDTGARDGTVLIDNDTATQNPITIHLKGAGDSPRLVLSADPAKGCADAAPALDFGDVRVGQTVVKPVTALSCGTRPVQVTSVALDMAGSAAFTIDTPPAAAPLAPGGKTSMNIRYSPTALGPAANRLRIASTDLIAPVQFMNITGKGVLPAECRIEVSLASVDFGSAVQGSTTVRTITLHNAGGLSCGLSRIAVDAGGSAARFAIQTAPAVPYLLAGNDLVDIRLAYQPLDAAGPDQGELQIDTTDTVRFPGGTAKVALRGTPTPQPECHLEIVPPKPSSGDRLMNFGTVGIGDTKDLDLTMKNTGGAVCNIRSTQWSSGIASGTFAIRGTSPALPASLAIGQTATITVRFSPTFVSTYYPYSNFFIVDTNAVEASECTSGTPSSTQQGCKKVGLQAAGDRVAIDPVPKSIDFGTVTIGCSSADQTVTVYNTGNASVTVSAISVNPGTAPFTITAQPAMPYGLAPSGSFVVRVKYRPPDANVHTALLAITHTAGTTTVPLRGQGSVNRHQVDTWQQLSQPKTDILVVMDDSCSMNDKQQWIAANAQTFINSAAATSNDFQLGVVTTDVDGPAQAGCWTWEPGCPPPWDGMTITPGVLWYLPKIVTRSTPSNATAFAKNLQPGSNGSYEEKGLEGARMALSNPIVSDPTKNLGFLRPDAKLAILAVSDEDDQSPMTDVQYYVDFFYSIKGARNSQMFAFHSIVGDSPGGCSGNGTAVDGTRYVEVTRRTNGIFRSVCSSNWGAIAQSIGLDAFAARSQYFLSRTADPATLVCKVNNVVQTKGTAYTYDTPTNSIVFASSAVPAAGATITCDYDTLCL